MKAKIRAALTSRHAWLWLALFYLAIGVSNGVDEGWGASACLWNIFIAAIFTIFWWAFGDDDDEGDDEGDE